MPNSWDVENMNNLNRVNPTKFYLECPTAPGLIFDIVERIGDDPSTVKALLRGTMGSEFIKKVDAASLEKAGYVMKRRASWVAPAVSDIASGYVLQQGACAAML
jgi:hypothetical protein